MRLLSEAQSGDLLLVEAIDRLSRLEHSAWVELKDTLNRKGLIIVSMDYQRAGRWSRWQAMT